MAENKTKATDASVADHLDAIADEQQRKDCAVISKMLARITKQKPKMWGPTIVGFGSYHYVYESGREGDSCLTGFAARGKDIAIYLVASGPKQPALLKKLGKHKMGKACLTIRRLADVDVDVLEALVVDSITEIRKRYPDRKSRPLA